MSFPALAFLHYFGWLLLQHALTQLAVAAGHHHRVELGGRSAHGAGRPQAPGVHPLPEAAPHPAGELGRHPQRWALL